MSSQVFLYNSLGGGGSAEGTSSLGGPGVCSRKILKIRTLEIPFPVILSMNIYLY